MLIRLEMWAGRFENYFYAALFIALVLGAWRPVLGTSFILDETGLIWAISGGAHEIIPRAIHFPQSILYCFLVWSVAALTGIREIALRLPSVLAAIVASYLLYRIGARLVDRTAGAIAALLWVLLPNVTAVATIARPYMMGTLAVIAAFWMLLRWLDSPTKSRWIAFIALAALPAYFSYFFVLVLLPQLLYAIFRFVRSRSLPLWQLLWVPLCIGILELPLLAPLLSAVADRNLHTYLGRPGLSEVVNETIPHALAYGLIIGTALHLVLPVSSRYRRISSGSVLALSWAAIPIALSFAVSILTPTKIFASRYLMAASPGLALYFAFLLRGFNPASLRIAVMACTAAFAVTGFGPDQPDFWHLNRYGDYRSANAFLSRARKERDLPVFAFSGFIEGRLMTFPVSDSDRDCLLAPFLVYPAGGQVTLLPSGLHPGSRQTIDRFLEDLRVKYRQFLLYTGNPGDEPAWFIERVVPGFQEEWLYSKGDVGIVRYTRK